MQDLVQALGDIATALPDLLEDIQGQLLDLLSLILSGKPFSPLTKGKAVQGLVHSLSMSELTASEQTKLALNTIGLMDFGRVSGCMECPLVLFLNQAMATGISIRRKAEGCRTSCSFCVYV